MDIDEKEMKDSVVRMGEFWKDGVTLMATVIWILLLDLYANSRSIEYPFSMWITWS